MIFKYILIFTMLFLYLTQVRSAFFTFPIFYFISVLGFIFFILNIMNNKVSKIFAYIILINIMIVLVQFISFIVNREGDFSFLREIVLYNFLSMMFCLFFYKINIKNKINFNYELVIACAVLIQLIISFYAFINPPFFDFIFAVFPQNLGLNSIEGFNEIRMVTLGTPFYGSAILSSMVLLLLAQKINYIKGFNFYLFLLFVVISILSILSARSAIIGVFLSICLIFSELRSNYKYFVVSIPFVIVFLLFSENFVFSNRLSDFIEYGFEFIYDYSNSQASESVEGVSDMLSVRPDSVKTWFIGDGYYKAPNGIEYYKYIDVGFLRAIFNFGIVGLLVFIFLNIFLLYEINKEYLSKRAKILILICFFLLMIKGLANIFPYLMLMYTLSLLKNNRSSANDFNRNSIL